LGEVAFLGCPALKISDLSRAIYEIHSLSHSVEGSHYRRHISFDKIKEMPSIVAEGFDVIADEAHTILREQAEKNGGSKTET
jgi:hypothetical protein